MHCAHFGDPPGSDFSSYTISKMEAILTADSVETLLLKGFNLSFK